MGKQRKFTMEFRLDGPTELVEHNIEFLLLVKEVVETKLDGSRRYGCGTWNSLGAKGLFADINRKFGRLRMFVWEGMRLMSKENIEDTLRDMAVYAVFMIMSLRREAKDDSSPHSRRV
jgi:hypothetical protein